MKTKLNNLIPIEDSVRAIWDFITYSGQKPIPPDASYPEAYSCDKLGSLGEQYVECIFKDTDIKRSSLSKKRPSPDFKICINGKEFLLETKIVKNLYQDIYQLLYEIVQWEKRYDIFKKVEALVRNCKLNYQPAKIRYQDKFKLKNKLRRIIKKINLPLDGKIEYKLKGRLRTYTLSLEPLKNKNQEIINTIEWPPGVTISLENIIFRKKRQIASSDILVIILLDNRISHTELLEFFYAQNNYDKSIWALKFRDEKGGLSTIDEKLKCIIVIYPVYKTCLIFPSHKYFEDFSDTEYFYLKRYLEGKDFKFIWAKQIDYRDRN